MSTKTRRPCYRCKKTESETGWYSNGFCRPCGAAYYRELNRKNPERNAANHKRYYEKHRVKMLAEAKAYNRKFRDMVLDHYGRKCACCGESRFEFLAIDHINGDGAEHRRQICGRSKGGSGLKLYRWLRDNGFPEGFRTLCHNCNLARGLYGSCPHERERINTDEFVSSP